jgi:hypothetical protein
VAFTPDVRNATAGAVPLSSWMPTRRACSGREGLAQFAAARLNVDWELKVEADRSRPDLLVLAAWRKLSEFVALVL